MTEETPQPKIAFLVPSENGYVPADKQYYQTAMRVSRHDIKVDSAPYMTYGDYFQGIAEVLSQEGCRRLAHAVSMRLADDVHPSQMEEIRVFAEKHGSDYHPARVEVEIGERWIAFVMNVAVGERGKARLCNEFDVLQRLNLKHGFSFLPRAYFRGEALVRNLVRNGGEGGCEAGLRMFLADWFEGYHEFHLSDDRRDGARKMILWEGNDGKRYLDAFHVREVYAQAAKIMTLCYDLGTFEQIFPWHHAAGDFVVKTERGLVDVKLITARQYVSMIGRTEGISVMDALLFFLLNLSIRTRLDRLDGVGDLAWAQDACVDATVEGFFEGLKMKERQDTTPSTRGLVDAFVRHAVCVSKQDLSDMFHALVDACNPAAPDIPVIRTNLEQHISTFRRTLQKRKVSDF